MQKNKTIGIVGAGQLGRMMALAGIPMGLTFEFLDANPDSPAADMGELHLGKIDDLDAIESLARRVDVLTFDVENVPAKNLAHVSEITNVQPASLALETAQDRLLEKQLFQSLEIPTARFAAVNCKEDFIHAAEKLGYPCVLKTRRLGYDGRGQRFVHKQEQIDEAWEQLHSHELILEEFINYTRELSIIVARSPSNEVVSYPLTENVHSNGILHVSKAPYLDDQLYQVAQSYASKLCQHFDYAGILTVELFSTKGQLLVNEIAPRVHNSGHWTIEGAATSQFENHLRAILDLPLGATTAKGHSAMLNFLGSLPNTKEILSVPALGFHDYGKSMRPSRKVGHATVVADTADQRDRLLEQAKRHYQANL